VWRESISRFQNGRHRQWHSLGTSTLLRRDRGAANYHCHNGNPQPPTTACAFATEYSSSKYVEGQKSNLGVSITKEETATRAGASSTHVQLNTKFAHADQIGLTNLEIIPSSFAENLSKSLSPFEYVLETATRKCMAVYEREVENETDGEPALIIGADTIVVGHFGEILEKPRSEAEHIGMLKMLRDTRMHKVYTAVACAAPLESARDPGYALETHVEETSVKFDKNCKTFSVAFASSKCELG